MIIQENDLKVTKIYCDRDKWLKEIPDIIYKLKKDYNFIMRYGGMFGYTCIHNFESIEDYISKKHSKNIHKMIIYRSDGLRYYLVVYSKKNPTVYICDAYKSGDDNCWIRVKRFIKKFYDAYDKAKKELDEQPLINGDETN